MNPLPSSYFYKDPLSQRRVPLWGLLSSEEDCVWEVDPSTSEVRTRKPPEFHDRVASSVFPDLDARIPIANVRNFILSRSNVMLAGYRCYIGRDGSYNIDESLDGSQAAALTQRLCMADELSSELVGFRSATGEGITFDCGQRRVYEIAEPVLSLASLEPSNYGSFLFRTLPKIIDAFRFNRKLKILVPIYHGNFKAYLHLLGILDEQIIPHEADAIYSLAKVLIPGLRNPECWLDEGSAHLYDGLRYRYGAPQIKGRKLFLTRNGLHSASQGSGGRVMTNESELREKLLHNGYVIVEPSRLNAVEQIMEFSSAEMIVTASGSAMFNSVFCHAGTKILDIESEPHWIHAHLCLFGSRNLRFGISEALVHGSRTHHHLPFEVDVNAVMRRLGEFERSVQCD